MAFDLNFQPKEVRAAGANGAAGGTGTAGMSARTQIQPPQEQEDTERGANTTDSVQISSEAVGRYAEERGATQSGREAEERLSGLQNSIEEMREGASTLRQQLQSRQESSRTAEQQGEDAVQAEQAAEGDYSAQLAKIAEAAGTFQQQQKEMVESGSTFAVELDPARLGSIEAADGTTVTVADLSAGERADPAQDPELAAQVAAQAEEDLAAAGTQVENYRAAMAQTGDIGGAEELLSADTADALADRVTQSFSGYDPAALYNAAAAGISGTRTLDLLV